MNNLEPQPAVPPMTIVSAITRFFRDYLVCSDEQLTVLALWIIHAWCYRAFPVTPYLNISSPEPQCGKSLLVHLLNLLSPSNAWLAHGPSAATLIKRMLAVKRPAPGGEGAVQNLPSVLLLDDREYTLGSSDRHYAISLLNCGASPHSRYTCEFYFYELHEFLVFCPKAFAGNTPLPRSLAERSIPVVLQRKKRSQVVRRFHPDSAAAAARPIREWLEEWTRLNSSVLIRAAMEVPVGIPLHFTPRQQECAEPLLHIADRIGASSAGTTGESFPDTARKALATIFPASRNDEYRSQSLLLLADVRDAFTAAGNPAFICTQDLLKTLQEIDDRPWADWTKGPAHALSRLLRPFGISSRAQRVTPSAVLRVYCHDDFTDAWERYL